MGLLAIPRQLEAQITTKVSVATGGAAGQGDVVGYKPAVSADGRIVAFASYAPNLVAGDTNDTIDVFVHDRQSGVTTRVSVASDGTQGNDISEAPALSADGRYVAFQSAASTFVPGDTNFTIDVFVHDRATGTTSRESVRPVASRQVAAACSSCWPTRRTRQRRWRCATSSWTARC